MHLFFRVMKLNFTIYFAQNFNTSQKINLKSGQNKLEKSGLEKSIKTGNPDQFYSASGADRHCS